MSVTVLNRTLCLDMVANNMVSPYLMVVRPTVGAMLHHSTLEQELAWRLLIACRDASWRVEICSSRELCDVAEEELRRATVLVINPLQCTRTSGKGSAFLSAVASAHKRILASVEPAESAWYGKQFTLPLHFDAVFDIGFVSQKEKHRFSDVPYHFVFNGPTRCEERTIAELSPPRKRPIRWALAGYPTTGRLDLATRLTEEFDPGGFVFMPGKPSRPASDGSIRRSALARHEKISPSGLAAVLSETSYYVWTSAHDFAYYESPRYVAALRAGAVPCKIADGGSSQELSQIPGIFSSVQSFCAAAQEEGAPSMYRLAKDFYLSRGLLAAHLKEVLEFV